MGMSEWSPAFRRYQWRVGGAMFVYVVLIAGVVWLFAHQRPEGPLAYAAAVLPALPLIGLFAALGLFLKEETDEFQRYLMVRQILIGTGLTLVIASVWGFLEAFLPNVHHFEAYWIVVVWFAMFGAARCVVRWGS